MDALPPEIRIVLFVTLALSVVLGVCLPAPRRGPAPRVLAALALFGVLAFAGSAACLLSDHRALAAIAVIVFVHTTVVLMWATSRREDGGGPPPDEGGGGGWDDGPDPDPAGDGGPLAADWFEGFTRDFWAHVEARDRVGAGR